jgi:hypothetical protein
MHTRDYFKAELKNLIMEMVERVEDPVTIIDESLNELRDEIVRNASRKPRLRLVQSEGRALAQSAV